MRVLFVTNMWPDELRPWFGTFIRSQARSLESLGVELDLFVMGGDSKVSKYGSGALGAILSNRRPQFDVVHAHYGHSAAVARLNLRRPLVVSYCGDDLLGTPDPKDPARRTVGSQILAFGFAQLARAASATITKSAEMSRKLPASCRARNHIIPNGVDLQRFSPTEQPEARRRLGWPADERVALFVGDPRNTTKNFPLAQAACSQASNADDLRLRVAWKVDHGEMSLWLSAADALIFTSTSEGSPNAVKEAMACGLPIVSTPVGDVPERLAGIPGSAVVSPDAGALGQALAVAVRHGRSKEAQDAIAELGVERVGRRVLEVYESVLKRERGNRRFTKSVDPHERSTIVR